MWWCAALCGGVARQTGHETQFCSQLVVASVMIGRLCKVLWPCVVQRRGRRRANEDEEGVSQGGRSGLQSTHAFATHEVAPGRQARRAGLGWGLVGQWMNDFSRPLEG